MVKGYKATYNYKCRNQLYEVGQEYKMNETPSLCTKGFHYCSNAVDVLYYYNFLSCFKLLEIEDLSADTVQDPIFGEKSCTNHMKIIREIVGQELLDLLEFEVVNECNATKTFKSKNLYLYSSQEICWDFDHDMDIIDIMKHGNCYTDRYYYDKQRNLKFLTNHYGSKYVFTDKGFVDETKFGKRKW